MQGNAPPIPRSVEPRLADIIRRSLVVAPPQRQDVTAMKHALSSLNELLRIEAGGTPSVPANVLHNADILVRPDSLINLSHTIQEAQSQVSTAATPSAVPQQHQVLYRSNTKRCTAANILVDLHPNNYLLQTQQTCAGGAMFEGATVEQRDCFRIHTYTKYCILS